MTNRIDLHTKLEEVLGSDNVYFQPPSNLKMTYPCIVYNRALITSEFADNTAYKLKDVYDITLIEKDPDSQTSHDIMIEFLASFKANYIADSLYHNVFTIIF